jgi:hypothetical protein
MAQKMQKKNGPSGPIAGNHCPFGRGSGQRELDRGNPSRSKIMTRFAKGLVAVAVVVAMSGGFNSAYAEFTVTLADAGGHSITITESPENTISFFNPSLFGGEFLVSLLALSNSTNGGPSGGIGDINESFTIRRLKGGSASATLTMTVFDDGFTNGPQPLTLTNSASGTWSGGSAPGDSDLFKTGELNPGAFTTPPLGPFSPPTGSSTETKAGYTYSGSYSITQVFTVSLAVVGSKGENTLVATGDTNTQPSVVVPEPPSFLMASLALPLLGVGYWFHRRARARLQPV